MIIGNKVIWAAGCFLVLLLLPFNAHAIHYRRFYGRPLAFPAVTSQNRRPFFPNGFGFPKPMTATVFLTSGGESGVTGQISLEQSDPNGPVLVKGVIRGLKQGPHGFHVHMKGELGNNCKDAGSHFNPFMKKHGNPNANFFASTSKGPAHPLTTERHIGDLGNIFTASDNAPTHVFIVDHIITLAEGRENSILGRAFVLHAGEDDLGRGGDEESTKTGNAGGRVACGVITAS